MTGTLAVLNVGAGDLRVEITDDDAATDKTIDMLQDMFKHGYAVLVEIDGEWRRVKRIDRKTREYVLHEKNVHVSMKGTTAKLEQREPPKQRAKRAPMRSARAVGVARSAGGCAPRSKQHMLQLAREALRP